MSYIVKPATDNPAFRIFSGYERRFEDRGPMLVFCEDFGINSLAYTRAEVSQYANMQNDMLRAFKKVFKTKDHEELNDENIAEFIAYHVEQFWKATADANSFGKQQPMRKVKASSGLSEDAIRKSVVEYALTLGALHKRNVFRQGMPSGWPDDTFYLPNGQVLEVEFKRSAGGKLTQHQEDRIAQLRDNRQWIAIVFDVEQGKAVLNAVCHGGSAVPTTDRCRLLDALRPTGKSVELSVFACKRMTNG